MTPPTKNDATSRVWKIACEAWDDAVEREGDDVEDRIPLAAALDALLASPEGRQALLDALDLEERWVDDEPPGRGLRRVLEDAPPPDRDSPRWAVPVWVVPVGATVIYVDAGNNVRHVVTWADCLDAFPSTGEDEK